MSEFIQWDASTECVIRFVEPSAEQIKSAADNGLCYSAFVLAVKAGFEKCETPVMELRGTGMKVKFRIWKDTNVSQEHVQEGLTHMIGYQMLLVEPADDVVVIASNGRPLTDASILVGDDRSCKIMTLCKNSTTAYSSLSEMIIAWLTFYGCPWKPEFNVIEPEQMDDPVVLKVGAEKIKVSKSLLISKSDVIKSMIESDKFAGVIQVNDFSFEVVKEMVRFVIHGYCTGWAKHSEELIKIAAHFQVKRMMELAVEKKGFINQIDMITSRQPSPTPFDEPVASSP
jgi:hypothetical protein